MPTVKFVNETNDTEYNTEQDVCSLLCYAFDLSKTTSYGHQYVGCAPSIFPEWYMKNPLAVHELMEFNHKRKYKHQEKLAKHRVISFAPQECKNPRLLKWAANDIIEFYNKMGFIAAYAIHFDKRNPHIHVIVDTLSYVNLNVFNMSNDYEFWSLTIILNRYKQYHANSRNSTFPKEFLDEGAVPMYPAIYFSDMKNNGGF